MVKKALVCLAFLTFATLLGQQPSPRYNNPANEVVDYALKNVQQEGSFYFLPFPAKFRMEGFGNFDGYPKNRAAQAQLVLTILDRFETARNLEITSFQLIRDQKGGYAIPIFHGIFLKAKPASSHRK